MESNKSKVLLFTDWYLPGFKAGGPISSCAHLVESLGDSVDFRIICSDRDYMDSEPYRQIVADKWIPVGKALVKYLSPENQTYNSIFKLIEEFTESKLYINGVFSKSFSIFPLRVASRLNREVILAPRGMLAPGALGIKSGKKRLYLAVAKSIGWYSKVHFHATNEHEADHIKKHFPKRSRITVIPNLPAIRPGNVLLPQKEAGEIKIVCVARIAQEKNIHFALECLQSLSPATKVSMRFIGSFYDVDYAEKCKKLAAKLPENVDVEFPGAMPPDAIQNEYQKAHLLFLPTLGENYGHAIIEALLSGTPVLISDRTPWRDLEKDGLGADISLEGAERFTNFIGTVAKMDYATYVDNYGHIAEKVLERIHLRDSVSKYKSLFQ